jgi:hypothetical protein
VPPVLFNLPAAARPAFRRQAGYAVSNAPAVCALPAAQPYTLLFSPLQARCSVSAAPKYDAFWIVLSAFSATCLPPPKAFALPDAFLKTVNSTNKFYRLQIRCSLNYAAVFKRIADGISFFVFVEYFFQQLRISAASVLNTARYSAQRRRGNVGFFDDSVVRFAAQKQLRAFYALLHFFHFLKSAQILEKSFEFLFPVKSAQNLKQFHIILSSSDSSAALSLFHCQIACLCANLLPPRFGTVRLY